MSSYLVSYFLGSNVNKEAEGVNRVCSKETPTSAACKKAREFSPLFCFFVNKIRIGIEMPRQTAKSKVL